MRNMGTWEQDIKCSECQQWAPEASWRDCEMYCEDCGEHMALECPACLERFDEIYTPLERRDTETPDLPPASRT